MALCFSSTLCFSRVSLGGSFGRPAVPVPAGIVALHTPRVRARSYMVPLVPDPVPVALPGLVEWHTPHVRARSYVVPVPVPVALTGLVAWHTPHVRAWSYMVPVVPVAVPVALPGLVG